MNNTVESLEAVLGSPSDREDMIVQVFTKESNFEIAQISVREAQLSIEWLGLPDGKRAIVNATELAEIITRAQERLLEKP